MSKLVNHLVLVWAVGLTGFLVMGMGNLTQFSPNTIISSSEVNGNFAAIKTAVDSLEISVATLQADLAAQAANSSQGVWHVWNAPASSSTLTTSTSTLATTTLSTIAPEDAVLGIRVEGTADVTGANGAVIRVRLIPTGAGSFTVSDAQFELPVGSGQSFSGFGSYMTSQVLVPSFPGTYTVRVDANVTPSGTTQLNLTSLRVRVLVLEKSKTVDPSPRFS